MAHRGTMGLCVLAVLGLAGIGTGEAAALPEVGRCVAQPGTGKYKDANCTQKAKQNISEKKFEFTRGAEKPGFTSSYEGEPVLETEVGDKIICRGINGATGKYDNDGGVIKEVESVVLTLERCLLLGPDVFCHSKGASVISTFMLKGPLGYISGEKTATPLVGLELTPETKKGLVAEFECDSGFGPFKLKGKEGAVEGRTGGNCFIAPIEHANEMSLTSRLLYSGSGGKQNPQHFQDTSRTVAKYCNLELSFKGGAFEAMTLGMTTQVTNEEALEIKA
jgi:hypothetical protein